MLVIVHTSFLSLTPFLYNRVPLLSVISHGIFHWKGPIIIPTHADPCVAQVLVQMGFGRSVFLGSHLQVLLTCFLVRTRAIDLICELIYLPFSLINSCFQFVDLAFFTKCFFLLYSCFPKFLSLFWDGSP